MELLPHMSLSRESSNCCHYSNLVSRPMKAESHWSQLFTHLCGPPEAKIINFANSYMIGFERMEFLLNLNKQTDQSTSSFLISAPFPLCDRLYYL